jgi:quinoprotein glucose dehydrogenase
VALNPDTGRQLWAFDPHTNEEGRPYSSALASRGMAFWRGRNGHIRVLLAGRQRLFSVDARTGKLDQHFGGNGAVWLTENLGRPIPLGQTHVSSPPVVYKNLVFVGNGTSDRIQYPGDPPGTIQAFDIETGRRVWVFFVVPQSASEPAADTWENGSWKGAGHANVWAPMTLDEARGLLYLPTSTPSSDYWGGARLGKNLFADSIVCLDAATGKMKWYFQGVHHGLWDYDFGSPPNLVTITVNGKTIDALAQVSKQGFVYVLDRVTGAPIWPIQERPVETATDVPGEHPWPTQPFPTKPPPLVPQGISLDDANDLTPEIKALATEQLKRFRLGPLFTPPSLRGTVQRPAQTGGSNWGGAAFDPETGTLYAKVSDGYHISRICKNDDRDPLVKVAYSNYCGQFGLFAWRGPGTDDPTQGRDVPGAKDYVPDSINYSFEPLSGIPLTKPPYGYLVAVDLNRGEIAWRVPFGVGSDAVRKHPLLRDVTLPDRLGTIGQPGVLITKGGLVFGGGGDPYLYAFDKATGKELWQGTTLSATSGNPMTYRTKSGRQFVAIASGGGPDATLLAFALGSGRQSLSTPPAATRQGQSETGAAAFSRVCQPCHGVNGHGGVGPGLVPITLSLTSVLAIVREGTGQMPPISSRELSDEAVARIVEHLRGVQ